MKLLKARGSRDVLIAFALIIGVAHGYTPENGACRDNQGKYGARYENGDASYLECKQACDTLGEPCQAYDTDARENGNGSNGWCGLWGVTFIKANTPMGFNYACESNTTAKTCDHPLPVTHGDPHQSRGNVCYLRHLRPTPFVPPTPPSPVPTPRKPDGASSLTFSAFPEPAIVPWPKSIFTDNQYLNLDNTSGVCIFSAVQSPVGLDPANTGTLAAILQEEIVAATSGGVKPQLAEQGACPTDSTMVIDLSIDSKLAGEASIFTVGRAHSRAASDDASNEVASGAAKGTGIVKISGATYSALVGATAILLQSLEHSSDCEFCKNGSGKTCAPLRWRLPFISVPASAGAATGAATAATGAGDAKEGDEAAVFNRGLMVDVARSTHTLADLKKYVMIARLYRLNTIHLHFTGEMCRRGCTFFPPVKHFLVTLSPHCGTLHFPSNAFVSLTPSYL
jgi:hypothetical protein